jgi:hypothetical protein
MSSRKKKETREIEFIEPYTSEDYSELGILYAEITEPLKKGVRFPVNNDANIPIIYPNIVHSVSSERSISSLNTTILLDNDKISILNTIDPVKLENSYSHRGDNRLVQAYSSAELIDYLDSLEVNYENAREKGYYIGLLSDVYIKAKESGKLGKPSRRVRTSDEEESDSDEDDLFNKLKYGSSYSSKSSSSSSSSKSSSSSSKSSSSSSKSSRRKDEEKSSPKKRGRPRGSTSTSKTKKRVIS